jgi:hypothetical protein
MYHFMKIIKLFLLLKVGFLVSASSLQADSFEHLENEGILAYCIRSTYELLGSIGGAYPQVNTLELPEGPKPFLFKKQPLLDLPQEALLGAEYEATLDYFLDHSDDLLTRYSVEEVFEHYECLLRCFPETLRTFFIRHPEKMISMWVTFHKAGFDAQSYRNYLFHFLRLVGDRKLFTKLDQGTEFYEVVRAHYSPKDTLAFYVDLMSYFETPVAQAWLEKLLQEGISPNLNANSYSLMALLPSLRLRHFLKEKGGRCYSIPMEAFVEAGISHFLYQPEAVEAQLFTHLEAPFCKENKIPYSLHSLWLTSNDSPREMPPANVDMMIANWALFQKAPVQWEFILWTNNPHLFPKSVQRLQQAGITVRNIHDYDLDYIDLIDELIHKNKLGTAVDFLKHILIESHGGAWADNNYQFNRDITDEAHRYDYIITNFSGCFFAASPHHPISKKNIQIIHRNITNPPDYIKEIFDPNGYRTVWVSTGNPLLGYLAAANENGNIDVIYPNPDIQKLPDRFFFEENPGQVLGFTKDEETLSDPCELSYKIRDLWKEASLSYKQKVEQAFNNSDPRFKIGEDNATGDENRGTWYFLDRPW